VTSIRVSIAAAIASILLVLVVLELIRGRRLKERYALLWLATGLVLLGLSLWRSGLNTIASWLGVGYPPTILFAVATLFIVVVLLDYSTALSRIADQNSLLAQRLALLEERVRTTRADPVEVQSLDDVFTEEAAADDEAVTTPAESRRGS
jgi:hypothetical protein